ncbi:alanine racemase [Microlunatus parietis]|uniref:Diaminopimelate decarboxylase n=1 Tax=Microlunatus parietis TaxID=682979 RepID=A0A7Y9I822_9ACTN|nr:alanine racemase [Microlunatus parietis]NYE71464.1 diaminopimelate decarboxylase [Microlunatus parietis]
MGLTDRELIIGNAIMAPPLTAYRDPWERGLLADPDLLAALARAAGGPFHVLHPERVISNVTAFRAALAESGVTGTVHYARKANKAACVIDACARAGAGADVSSVGELQAALGAGIRGSDLMITGPAKPDRLLWLAARHDGLIAIDAPDELERLIMIAGPEPARVLLRVRPPGSSSRFGFGATELDAAVTRIGDAPALRLHGFGFHLSGYDPAARTRLAGTLIERCLGARALGHPADTISIGGGFAVDYAGASEWAAFADGLPGAWCHGEQDVRDLYPYHAEVAGAAMLTAVLRADRLAERLRDNGIRLAVEPGRALLDRAGCSVFGVLGVKTLTARGLPYRMITVDGSSLSLSEQWFGSEYLPDPVLWPAGDPAALPVPTSVGGATCLESDLLSRRRIPLAREPRIGDLLVYPNTAGYQMDSNESSFHNQPIPPKFVLHADLRWSLDQLGESS